MYYEIVGGEKNQTHINPFLQNFRMALSRKTEIYEIKIQCRKLNVSKVFRCFLGLCAVRASGFGRAAVQQRSWNERAQFSLTGCFPTDWSFAENSNLSLSLDVFYNLV